MHHIVENIEKYVPGINFNFLILLLPLLIFPLPENVVASHAYFENMTEDFKFELFF